MIMKKGLNALDTQKWIVTQVSWEKIKVMEKWDDDVKKNLQAKNIRMCYNFFISYWIFYSIIFQNL